jgi:ribonuclease HI
MAKKRKYYVVWQGNEPGIYNSWEECQLQIKGYPNAKYKSFKTHDEAMNAFHGDYESYKKKSTVSPSTAFNKEDILWDSVSVDAACSGNPGNMEYRGVHTKTGEEIFRKGVFKEGTNNIGEFLALVHMLAYLKTIGESQKTIYTDSKTAIAWIRNKKVKTTLKQSAQNKILFALIDRAIHWLKENSYKNPILKWDTKNWGEIPADFGRK